MNIIREAIKGQGMHAPEGIVTIEFDNNHTWKMIRIGKITPEGQFSEKWTSHKAIRPIAFPTIGNQNWSGLLERLYTGWNNNGQQNKTIYLLLRRFTFSCQYHAGCYRCSLDRRLSIFKKKICGRSFFADKLELGHNHFKHHATDTL